MPKSDAAAVRAHLEYERHFGVPEDAFVEPDMPAIVTAEYRPVVEAARQMINYISRLRVAEHIAFGRDYDPKADTLTMPWRAALRSVVGDPA